MSEFIPPILAANLRAIQTRDPDLLERLCLPVDSDHVETPDDGPPMYRIHRSWHPFALSVDLTEATLQGVPDQGDVLLFGVGLGEQLRQLLRGRRNGRVTAWDRDPWMVRLLLSEDDYTGALNTGRLRFRLGADLLDEVQYSGERPVVSHPFFADRYDNEHRLLTEGVRDRRALVCAGTLFVDEIADALRARGMSVGTWEPARLSREELQHCVAAWRPEVIVSVNHIHEMTEACRELGVPLVIWEIDPATDELRPCAGPSNGTWIFTWRQAQVQRWRDAGYVNVAYAPLAADPERRKPVEPDPEDDDRYRSPVAFVGASMVDQGTAFREQVVAEYALWRGGSPLDSADEGQLLIEEVVNRSREDFSVYRVPEDMADLLGGFTAALRRVGRDVVPLVAEMVAADKRVTYVANVGQVGATVWGDEGWDFVQQYDVKWMGSAGHRAELNKVYCGATINLDIGRAYQSDIITMRVFDVMACGGFVLAEHSDALAELFTPGVELDSYRTLDEMLEKVEYWLARPEEAAAIGKAAREAVCRDHTIAGRLDAMLAAAGIE